MANQSQNGLRQRLRSLRFWVLVAAVAGAAGFHGKAAIAQATWTGTTSGAWSSGANWVGTPPVNSGTSALVFVSATSGSAITATNDLTGLTVSSLTLGSPRDVTLAGNAITLSGGITNNTGSWQFVTLPISLAAGDRSINGTTGRLYLTGSLSGSSAIVKTGGGDLVLAGANTLTGNGTLVINGTVAGSGTFNRALELNGGFGTVFLTSTAALGSAANYVNFVNSANGTLALQTDTSMTGYSLSAGSFQGITISVDRATAGTTITHTLGTLNLGSSSATFNQGGNVSGVATVAFSQLSMTAGADHQPVTIAGSAQIVIGSAYNTFNTGNNRRLQLDGTFNGNTIGTIGDVIPGGPAGAGITSVIKANSSTWILTSSNAYTGSTTINQGTLQLGNGGTAGSIRPTSVITGSAGALLAFNRSDTITQGTDFAPTISGSLGLVKMAAGNLVLSGSNSLGNGAGSQVLLFSNAGSGTVTLRNTAALGAAGNLVRFSGGGSGVLDLQTDTSVNSFDAASGTGNGGTIIVNRATPGAGITHTLGVLDMSSITFTANTGSNVTSGTAGIAVNELRMTGGNDNAPVTLAGSATWTVGSASVTLNGLSKRLQLDGTSGGNTIGPITNTTNATVGAVVNLIKANSGTWTLTGANTYTGTTTVSAGSLVASSSNSLPGFGTAGRVVFGGGTLQIPVDGTAWTMAQVDTIVASATKTSGALALDIASGTQTQVGGYSGGIGLTKVGAGTLTLSGSNTFKGAFVIAGGRASVSGNTNISTGAAGTTSVGAAAAAGTLDVSGTFTTWDMGIGTTSRATGVVNQTGGLVTVNRAAGFNNLQIGAAAGAFGYYGLTSGTLTANELGVGGIAGGNGTGILDVSGGTVDIPGWITLSRAGNPGQNSVLNVTNSGTVIARGGNGLQANWVGTSIVNVSGDALLRHASGVVSAFSSGTGIVNLNGGTFEVQGGLAGGATLSLLNLNGGTLKSLADNTLIANSFTGVYVYGGGAIIDTNGFASTVNSPLLAASGSGVSSIAITGGGSGYVAPPLVSITGGGGTGATGFATIANGTISGITITNAGTGYTSAPTVTLSGGGGSGAAIGTVTTAANTSGGLTKAGAGVLTLSGSNAFSGATRVNAGGLTVANANALRSSTLDMNAADSGTVSFSQNSTLGGLSGSRSLDMGTRTLSIGGNGQSTTYSGGLTNGALTKLGSGTLTLSGSNGYTGSTAVDAGVLRIGAGGAAGSLASSSISVANGAVLAYNRTDNYGGAISSAISGSGGMRVDSGFLTLAGVNTYTGATDVLAGATLAVNGSLANQSLTVASGATLMGSGTIAGLTTIAGVHRPGNSPGVETFTNLTYNAGANVQWELWDNTDSNSPTAFDQIVVNGNLAFSGGTTLDLVFTGSASPSSFSSVSWANAFWDSNQEWLLYDVAGTLATANNLTLNVTNWQDSTGAFFQTARPGASFVVEQRDSDIYVVYAAVPEPGTLVLAGVGVAAVMARRYRRSRRGAA